MKRCPSCQRTYDDEQVFCSLDATLLASESTLETPPSDPEETMVAGTTLQPQTPPPGNVTSPQASLTDASVSYQPPPTQPQMSPPPPKQQQWGTPPAPVGINPNTILLGVVGLLVAVGVGLAIYFGARPGSVTSSSGTSNSSSPPSATNYNRFVGTWRDEERPNHTGVRFTEDGKIMDPGPEGREDHEGNYAISGDRAIITPLRGNDTATATIEADGRMRVEVRGRTFYMIRK